MTDSTIVQIGLTGIVVMLMVPGLIVEPGPISEMVGAGIIMSIWGIEWDGGSQ